LIERQMPMLARLAEIGMEIAEAAGRRAAAETDGGEAGPHAPDPALAFARAARAVRLTIALQSRLMGELAALDRGEALARVGEAHVRRGRVHRLVERAIEAHVEDEHEIERLSSEAWELLTDADAADIAGRSTAELVALICADLGLPMESVGPWTAEAFASPEDDRAGAVRPFPLDGGRVWDGGEPAAIAERARAAPS